jgi:hypothetical protein
MPLGQPLPSWVLLCEAPRAMELYGASSVQERGAECDVSAEDGKVMKHISLLNPTGRMQVSAVRAGSARLGSAEGVAGAQGLHVPLDPPPRLRPIRRRRSVREHVHPPPVVPPEDAGHVGSRGVLRGPPGAQLRSSAGARGRRTASSTACTKPHEAGARLRPFARSAHAARVPWGGQAHGIDTVGD